jgi:hypothetical protein
MTTNPKKAADKRQEPLPFAVRAAQEAAAAAPPAPLTAEERALLEGAGEGGEGVSDDTADDAVVDDGLPPADETLPEWVVLPPNLAMPKGRVVGFLRFRAHLTDDPSKGDRQVVLWNLTALDEKFAIKRCRGDAMRTVSEMAKQMIRAIDGVPVDWTGAKGPGNVDVFWDEIGSRYRQQMINYYVKTHALGPDETADFFANCIAIRTAH